MSGGTHKSGFWLPVLLAAVVLRAFIPVGYMPAAPSSGLLFVLCHEIAGLGAAPESASDAGHAEHHGGHAGDKHGAQASDGCTLGHILSLSFIDDAATPEAAAAASGHIDASEPASHFVPPSRLNHRPRGPPPV